MAPPHRVDLARLLDHAGERHRLRIVDHEHVVIVHPVDQELRVGSVHRLVELATLAVEVALADPVDEVVQALGQREELGLVRFDDHPLRRDAELAQHRDHGGQHLGDAAALGRRVDHVQRASREPLGERCRLRAKLCDRGLKVRDRFVVGEGLRSLDVDLASQETSIVPENAPPFTPSGKLRR